MFFHSVDHRELPPKIWPGMDQDDLGVRCLWFAANQLYAACLAACSYGATFHPLNHFLELPLPCAELHFLELPLSDMFNELNSCLCCFCHMGACALFIPSLFPNEKKDPSPSSKPKKCKNQCFPKKLCYKINKAGGFNSVENIGDFQFDNVCLPEGNRVVVY